MMVESLDVRVQVEFDIPFWRVQVKFDTPFWREELGALQYRCMAEGLVAHHQTFIFMRFAMIKHSWT
jgi:hypothetical protein